MATKELTYNGYLYLLNRIAYWLQKNNKKVTTKNEYKIGNDSKSLKVIINTIKKHGTNYNSNEFIGRYVEYIITSKKDDDDLPSYVSSKDGKRQYSKASYKDMVKRVVAFRKKNNRNPKTVKAEYEKINTTNIKKTNTSTVKVSTSKKSECKSPYKALPYDSKSSCDHMGQNTGYYCGPSMIQKMLYELGITGITQKQLASVAGTTTSGTDHSGLETAVAWVAKKKKVKLTCKWYNFSDLSWDKLGKIMCNKNQSFGCHIRYRDKWGHYEKPLSIYTDSKVVKVINSLGNKCTSSCYCGYVEERSFSTQKRYIAGISQKSVLVITKG